MSGQPSREVGSPVVAGVGDLMVGDSAISVGYGFASRYPTGMDEVARRIEPLLTGADLVLGNLECVLSHRGLEADSWRSVQMRGVPAYAASLRRAGFTHLSLANNHSTQHGVEAFRETIRVLEEAGIRCCGLRGENGWACRPVTEVVRGVEVGVLAYSLRPRQYDPGEPPYAEGSEGEMLADVRRLRERVERLVVSLHWGEEYGTRPSAGEVRLGRALVDEGVDLILGHHPHVLRPVETHGGGVVAYSLGNFVSNMTWQEEFRRTVVLRCSLDDPAGTLELLPARIDDSYVPVATGDSVPARPVSDLVGLTPDAYRRQTARTETRQRLRSYVHALRNLHRYDRKILTEWIGTVLRNKWTALRGRSA